MFGDCANDALEGGYFFKVLRLLLPIMSTFVALKCLCVRSCPLLFVGLPVASFSAVPHGSALAPHNAALLTGLSLSLSVSLNELSIK